MKGLTKAGPFGLPIYAWLAGIGALGLGLVVFLRASRKSSSATGTPADASTASPNYPAFQYVPYPYPVSGQSGGTPADTGTVTSGAGVSYPPPSPYRYPPLIGSPLQTALNGGAPLASSPYTSPYSAASYLDAVPSRPSGVYTLPFGQIPVYRPTAPQPGGRLIGAA